MQQAIASVMRGTTDFDTLCQLRRLAPARQNEVASMELRFGDAVEHDEVAIAEVDRGEWLDLTLARDNLLVGQRPYLDRLVALVEGSRRR